MPEQLSPTGIIPEWVSFNVAADILHRSPRTIRRWIAHGHLTAIRIGDAKGLLVVDIQNLLRTGMLGRIEVCHDRNK